MAEMRIKIGTAEPVDITTWKLHLIKSPSVMAADIKENNVVIKDYPENNGEDYYINPTPKLSAFDYEVTFAYHEEGITNSLDLKKANYYITTFYNAMLGKKITIYNDYKKQTMVDCYVKSYKEGEFYRGKFSLSRDIVIFSVTFRIPNHASCVFSVTG